MSQTVLITGASRGIGLGLVKTFLKKGFNVIATCRNPSAASELNEVLKNSKQNEAVALDVASDESVLEFGKYLESKSIVVDHLINNAGVAAKNHPHDNTDNIDRADMINQYNINVVGVAKVTDASGVLRKENTNGKVINISSQLGSIAKTQSSGAFRSATYRCSKAAQNMLTVCMSLQYPHITFLMVHPGWVQTDMGGAGGRTADIGVEESATGIYSVFSQVLFINISPRQLCLIVFYRRNLHSLESS